MRRSWQLLLFYAMLLWLGVMLMAGNLLVLPLVVLPASWRQPVIQWGISAVVRLFLQGSAACGLMRLDLRALDAVNARRGGMILVANHPSMIDVFLVLSRVRQAVCLMKSSVGFNLFLAVGARLAGYISNARHDRLVRHAADAVLSGQRLLVFPEGTRTVSERLNDLKPGVGLIAKLSRAPIQVVILRTNSPYLAKGWKIWRAPRFPLIYQARLGEVLLPSDGVKENMSAIRTQLQRELQDRLPIDPALDWRRA